MEKLDLRKQLKHFYQPSARQVSVVTVPEMLFLMADGKGDPNTSQEFKDAMMALYAAAYTLKFMVKLGPMQIDYPVMALEGLWWAEGDKPFDMTVSKDRFHWTVMMMLPDFITQQLLDEAKAKALQKREVPALDKVRLECFEEGQAAQIMHIGPYSAEAPNIERVHRFITDGGHHLRGKHHEIYLGDPRRTAPERLKTVIRQPFA